MVELDENRFRIVGAAAPTIVRLVELLIKKGVITMEEWKSVTDFDNKEISKFFRGGME